MDIQVERVPLKDKPILENLLSMYCYEWSQYDKSDVNSQGSYGYRIGEYWENEKYHPFFIRVDGILAGFVLVNNEFDIHTDYDYAMAEFFIMFKYRQSGIGRSVANTLFDKFHGKWELKRHPHNVVSVQFWDKIVSEYTKGNFKIIKSCPSVVYHDGTFADILAFEN
jgi:predicted acetyltransferase